MKRRVPMTMAGSMLLLGLAVGAAGVAAQEPAVRRGRTPGEALGEGIRAVPLTTDPVYRDYRLGDVVLVGDQQDGDAALLVQPLEDPHDLCGWGAESPAQV